MAGRSRQLLGVQPEVTVSGLITGDWPGAPELALTVTTVCCDTWFAACSVSAPPPFVHPGVMTG